MPKKMTKSGSRKASAARTRTNKSPSQRKQTNAAGSSRASGSTRAKRIRERREAEALMENVSAPPKRKQRHGTNSKASRNAIAKESKSKVRSRPER